MSVIARALTRSAWSAISGDPDALNTVLFSGAGSLPSAYPVTDFASATIATASLAIAELLGQRHGKRPVAAIDRRLASLWFGMSIRPLGWELPTIWDPLAGDYRTIDGWIRLHTNAPHHRVAAERVLGAQRAKDDMARAVAGWRKGDLEKAIVEAGGCAAEMRTVAEWAAHPQGLAVAAEPLVHMDSVDAGSPSAWEVPRARPLQGLRVLDLTRVLAGPVAGRFLAAYGAEVLRIDPPNWDEPGLVPEVTLGKRCARLDLHRTADRVTFEGLLERADVLLHGYRPHALDHLGFDPVARRALSPGLIDVCLDAYGWSGPWAARRGFDSLVQMSAGIADTGMRWRGADQPVPLPVQALDHGTGYLMAAAAIRGVTRRLARGDGLVARLSLARTAGLLFEAGRDYDTAPLALETSADLAPTIETTGWGQARRLIAPVSIDGVRMCWERPACALGSSPPRWQ